MAVPTIYEILPVLLRQLSHGKAQQIKNLEAAVANDIALTEEDRRFTLNNKQSLPLYSDRFEWAITHALHAQFIERTEPGHIQITQRGLRTHKKALAVIDRKYLRNIASWRAYEMRTRKRADTRKSRGTASTKVKAAREFPKVGILETMCRSLHCSLWLAFPNESRPEQFVQKHLWRNPVYVGTLDQKAVVWRGWSVALNKVDRHLPNAYVAVAENTLTPKDRLRLFGRYFSRKIAAYDSYVVAFVPGFRMDDINQIREAGFVPRIMTSGQSVHACIIWAEERVAENFLEFGNDLAKLIRFLITWRSRAIKQFGSESESVLRTNVNARVRKRSDELGLLELDEDL